jgi:hypothetical protein
MTLPRVRFTVRRMMVAVAAVAVALWGLHVRRQREAERRLAQTYESKAQFNESMAQLVMTRYVAELERSIAYKLEPRQGESDPYPSFTVERCKAFLAGYRTKAAYYSRLAKKYEYAASHPREPVPPDPPKP